MAGARSLSQDEHIQVKKSFTTLRNKLLYVLGKNTGFRISELLSIKISQVYQKDYLKVERKNIKAKFESREIILSNEAKDCINEYLNSLDVLDLNSPLFISREGNNKPLGRCMAHLVLKEAFNQAGLQGSVSTHSMKKTFALNVYEKSGHDLVMTQKSLGHKFITTTIKYLPVNQKKLDKIISEE